MIDQASQHFGADRDEEPVLSEVLDLERFIKARGVPKVVLINILKSLGAFPLDASPSSTIRNILSSFVNYSNSRQIDKFKEIIDSSSAADPYLKGIAENRR